MTVSERRSINPFPFSSRIELYPALRACPLPTPDRVVQVEDQEGNTPVNTKLLVAIFAVTGMTSGLHGSDFQPGTCKGLFNDVPEANDFCPWIEQLAADQVSAGCGDKKFCPDQPVTRQQAAELLEKAMRGTATWQVDAGTLDGLDSSAFVTAASLSWRSLRRQYYLDYPSFTGDHALEACTAPGFHVASIWEIQDLGTLVYDSQFGVNQPDSGNGPPTGAPGWVRTGGFPSNLNCQLWTTAAGNGVIAYLPEPLHEAFTNDNASAEFVNLDVAPWKLIFIACSNQTGVWCVEN